VVTTRPDLYEFAAPAVPLDAACCHPVPNNWVAIWVAVLVLEEETPRVAMQGAMRMSGADARLRYDCAREQ
jgi:hypothetical protein